MLSDLGVDDVRAVGLSGLDDGGGLRSVGVGDDEAVAAGVRRGGRSALVGRQHIVVVPEDAGERCDANGGQGDDDDGDGDDQDRSSVRFRTHEMAFGEWEGPGTGSSPGWSTMSVARRRGGRIPASVGRGPHAHPVPPRSGWRPPVDAWMRLDYIKMYAGIVAISIIGFLLFVAIDIADAVFCRWNRLISQY